MRAEGGAVRILANGLSALADLVYPPRCVACGRWGAWLCPACQQAAIRLAPPWCARCGRPLAAPGLCRRCRQNVGALAAIRSVSPYQWPLREAIHALKYEGLRALASPLGAMLAACWQAANLPGDLIVPVPLHPVRLRQRGYNQSTLLARECAQHSQVPWADGILRRVRDTPSQVGLSRSARRRNVQGAFQCGAERPAGREIILVDDVLTTGATLEACASALLAAGAHSVRALTLARAVDPRSRPSATPWPAGPYSCGGRQ